MSPELRRLMSFEYALIVTLIGVLLLCRDDVIGTAAACGWLLIVLGAGKGYFALRRS